MREERCDVCGSGGADIVCPRCRHIVCKDCYDEETRVCIDCADEIVQARAGRKRALLVAGVVLLVIGFSTVAAGLVAGLQVGSVSIIFPFLMGGVSPLVAGLYSLLFFAGVGCASLLPWYLHTRSEAPFNGGEYALTEERNEGEGFEHVEYMITTELERRLNKTITVEPRDASVILHSTADPGFRRSYPIPDGCDIEGLDYDYDGGYLVLRLHLVRSP